ncbi:uncharacterized protein BDW47DRAFT_125882 [Aspergillus candidus]|uniref:Uncharacterized protein n=1 Tax=Aspergillus candidus TaxID=41067 RepID=A0A2I2FB86_ASPCN|nr:hypothetical protein BDW47DRAFT_125882 [Aspergillus candidus]PLB37892.1 hypothetical protein BDW47DRAFT_125882 [Aspergillus candidus]
MSTSPASDPQIPTPQPPPPLTNISALARFEFEAGKANDGTKVLMIEWEDQDHRPSSGSWHVTWEGKQAVLPADEQANDHTRRLYFLLPPHVTIPPVVSLAYAPRDQLDGPDPPLLLNPLPAIFPPELGATGSSAGRKGVLHTIWAKKRLRVLDQEIQQECESNVEGVALHMALQEKDWIETNFGVSNQHSHLSKAKDAASTANPAYPMGPTTPVSPTTGGKLGEKLKGLKLQTGDGQLSPLSDAHHLLSPESPDVAVSSFNSFHRQTQPQPQTQPQTQPHIKAVLPPESIQAQQPAHGFAAMGTSRTVGRSSGGDDELFAKALSPRTPDLPRSPFSFAPERLV